MTDTIVQTIVDEDFINALRELNLAGAAGKHFVVMHDMEGGMVGFNIPNILQLKEIDE